MWVFYVFVCPLHGTHPQGQPSRQRFCYFFPPPDLLYPVDIVLWVLLKQQSTETHHSGEEWGVCSPSSQCEAEPITRHNTRFWETLGCFWMGTLIRIVGSGGVSRAAHLEGGRPTDEHDRWRFYPGLIVFISVSSQMDQNWSIDLFFDWFIEGELFIEFSFWFWPQIKQHLCYSDHLWFDWYMLRSIKNIDQTASNSCLRHLCAFF